MPAFLTDSQFHQFFRRLTLPTIINGPNAPPSIRNDAPSPMTPLWLDPERYPTLVAIRHLQTPAIAREIRTYFATRPNTEQLVISLQALTLPLNASIAMRHPEMDTVYKDFNPFIINNSNDLVTLLHRFIFRSVRQILRVLDNSRNWSFTNINHSQSNHCTSEILANVDPIVVYPLGALPKSPQLVILPFTPWEFTEKDFTNLSSSNRIFAYRSSEWITKSDRLWAYLYDICSDLGCHFFVITTYQYWCFGYFTLDYSEIHLSYTLSFDCFDVSIVEMLIYWIHSSFKINQIRNSQSEPIRMENKKRSADTHDHPINLEIKRRRLNEEILSIASAETLKWIQLPLGTRRYRFGKADNVQRRGRELQRVKDQLSYREKMMRRRDIKKQCRKMKLAKRPEAVEKTKPNVNPTQAEETGIMEEGETQRVKRIGEGVDIKEQSESESEAESDTELFRDKKDPTYFDEWMAGVKRDNTCGEIWYRMIIQDAERIPFQVVAIGSDSAVEDESQKQGQPEQSSQTNVILCRDTPCYVA